MKLLPLIEKFAKRLPKGLRGQVMDHVTTMRELLSEGILEEARNSDDLSLKKAVAGRIIRASTTLSVTIGFEPIPLADFPILTGIQILMVTAILHISGRKVSRKAAFEFMSAVGANVGMAMAFREGARAIVKLLPGLGSSISGAIAGMGTYAVGRAATAYFIDEVSLQKARAIFRRKPKTLPLEDSTQK